VKVELFGSVTNEPPDRVDHPVHYTRGGIETIDFIEAKSLGFHLGNAIKYISRSALKGHEIEDIEKAIWYLRRYMEVRKKENAASEE